MERLDIFVREKDPDGRCEILEFLEGMGYKTDEEETRTRQEIVESVLPITVDKRNKEYRMMGSVTCAAAAVSSGRMMTKEEFFRQF